jgi:hypothetical protein
MAAKMIPVASSHIAAVGHEDNSLFVQFKTGDVYEYPGYTADDHAEMLQAESVGKHFYQKVVQGNPNYLRLTDKQIREKIAE